MSVDNRNAANLTAVLVDYGAAGSADAPVMVTRGWLDPQNRRQHQPQPARCARSKLYGFDWDLQPDDYVFQAGHRIGLVVVSTDHDYTIRPAPGHAADAAPGRRAGSACPWWADAGARALARRPVVVDDLDVVAVGVEHVGARSSPRGTRAARPARRCRA